VAKPTPPPAKRWAPPPVASSGAISATSWVAPRATSTMRRIPKSRSAHAWRSRATCWCGS